MNEVDLGIILGLGTICIMATIQFLVGIHKEYFSKKGAGFKE